MALFGPVRQLKQLQTLVFKGFQLFNQGSARIESRSRFLPITWNFGKTLVTSNVYFKSDSNKSKSFVNHRCPYCEMDLSCKMSLDNHIAKCLNDRNFKDSEFEAFVQKEIMLDNHMKRKRLMKRMEVFLTRRFLEPDIPAYPIKVPLKDPNNISKKIPRRFQKRSPRRFPNRKISAVHLKLKPSECDFCSESFVHQQQLEYQHQD